MTTASRLEPQALGLTHAVVMGVAGTAPSFSLAASASILIAATGAHAPAIVLYSGLVMLGIALAFHRLNRDTPNAGASFIWVSQVFGPTLGFLSGWSVLVTSVLFMASATLPAASATLLLVAPQAEPEPFVLTLVALAWLLAVSALTLRGVAVAARVQSAMIAFELLLLLLLVVTALPRLVAAAAPTPEWNLFSLAGLDVASVLDGAVIALFLFWGWDISLNLAEETREGRKTSGRGAVLAMLILILVFTILHAVALVTLDPRQIAAAGSNLIFTVADALLPRPWSLLAIVVVMLSTVGALATTTLGFSRTLFAKSRHGVLHPRWQALHPRWNTPNHATLLFVVLGAALLVLSLALEDVARVLKIAITAIGLQSAFYYGLTGYACAWAQRRQARGPLAWLLWVLWPAASATLLWGAAGLLLRGFDPVTIAVGVGSILAGLVTWLWSRLGRKG